MKSIPTIKRENNAVARRQRACDDCEELMASNERRRRCNSCGSLVCAYCWHHVHQPAVRKRLQPGGGS